MCGVEAKIRQSCVQETDSGRATLTDIFCNTSGFSAKTVQAIYKETLYKVDSEVEWCRVKAILTSM